jgi:hypothetical protein
MSYEEIYCGFKKVPKGKKRGTAKQCFTSNQIRYYGIKAIDEDLLESLLHRKKKGPSLETQIGNALVKLKKFEYKLEGIRKIYTTAKKDKNKTKMKNLKEKYEDLYDEWSDQNKKYKKLVKKLDDEE